MKIEGEQIGFGLFPEKLWEEADLEFFRSLQRAYDHHPIRNWQRLSMLGLR